MLRVVSSSGAQPVHKFAELSGAMTAKQRAREQANMPVNQTDYPKLGNVVPTSFIALTSREVLPISKYDVGPVWAYLGEKQ